MREIKGLRPLSPDEVNDEVWRSVRSEISQKEYDTYRSILAISSARASLLKRRSEDALEGGLKEAKK
jgi:hypothetical protein